MWGANGGRLRARGARGASGRSRGWARTVAGCGPVAREARGEQAGPGPREGGRARAGTGGRSRGWVTPLGCSSPPTWGSTERVDGRAIGVSVRKALFELGKVILAQQINLLTQKTPKEEAEHCLSNYRGSLQKWEAVQYRYPPDRFAMRSQRDVRQHALAHAAQPAWGTRALVCGAARCRAAA